MAVFSGCATTKESATLGYKTGTYTASAEGNNGDVNVEVIFTDNNISSVKVVSHAETPGISDPAISRIPSAIVEGQTLAVDSVSGATVTSNAILSAVEKCAIEAGADVTKLKEKTQNTKTSDIVEELSTDIVVVGAGGGGIVAAIQASTLGKDVIVLEKLATVGGTSAHTEGMFAVDSPLQQEADVSITSAEALKKVMAYHHWKADPVLTKTFFDKSGETISWLMDLGVKFTAVETLGPSLQTWHVFEGLGEQYIKTLYDIAQDNGVKFYLETPATELITEDNMITGVKAQKADGAIVNIKAKAVILATGGFADSEEMINKYTDFNYEDIMAIGSPQRTGDGISMGINVGADTVGMSTVMMCGGVLRSLSVYSQLNAAAGRQPFLWVNEKAKRFADESIVFDFSFSGNAMSQQQEVFNVMDTAALEYIRDKGCFFGRGKFVPTGSKLTKVFEELEHEISIGNPDIFVADSYEELAQKMGVDPKAFTETVTQYNEYATSGVDEDFGKPDKFLLPVTKGPYYAFKLTKVYYCTVGGLKVTPNAEVLGTDGNVIRGLYAAGCDAGGLYGDSYDVGIAAGSQEGWTVNSGRIAAQHAVENLF